MTKIEKVESITYVDRNRIIECDCPADYGVGIESCFGSCPQEKENVSCEQCWNMPYKSV